MRRRRFLGAMGLSAAIPVASNGNGLRSDTDSEYPDDDPFVTFAVDEIEVNVLPGSEWVGEHTLRCALWGQSLANEYRPYDNSGAVRYHVYPPAPNGIAPAGAVALTSAGSADLFFHHPPEDELTPLDDLDDPRDSWWFRTVMHEYIHAESNNIRGEVDSGYGYPAGWFEHGFTEFTTKNHDISYYQTVFELVAEENIPNLSQVDGGYEYAFGLFIMKYLVEEYGWDVVNEIYWDPSGDEWRDTESAVENVLDMSIDQFTDDWQQAVTEWVDTAGEVPEDAVDGDIVQPPGWVTREPNPDIQTEFYEHDELVHEAVENPKSDSDLDSLKSYSAEEFEVHFSPGNEWVGEHTLRSALWGQALTNEYRPYENSGEVRYHIYPPARNGRAPSSAVAITSPGSADLFFVHPPKEELTPLDDLDDPRDSSWFRTLMHEYIHAESHTIRGEVGEGYSYPSGWFEHGFTEYSTKNHNVNYYQSVFELANDDNIPDISQLGGANEYAFGLFIMKYLVEEYGWDVVNEIYWDPSGDGWQDTEPAVENVLDISIDQFNSDWQQALHAWIQDAGDVPEDAVTNGIVQSDGWINRAPNPDIQTQFPELDELVAQAVDEAESTPTPEPTPSQTPDPTSSPTPSPTPDSSPTPGSQDSIPGPGIVGTIGSLVGAGYVAKWWTDRTDEDGG